jgi:hypothetical protein
MNIDPELKSIERKAFRAFFDDGLLEILIGILLLCIAAGDILDVIGVSFRWNCLAIAVSFAAFIWAKQWVTRPRIGYVVFGEKRRENRRKLQTLIILQLLTLGILVVVWTVRGPSGPLSGWGTIARQAAVAFFFFTLPFGVMAWYLADPWMLVPALLGPSNEIFRDMVPKPWIAMLTCGTGGAALVIAGLFLFVRFTRKYPLPEKEV